MPTDSSDNNNNSNMSCSKRMTKSPGAPTPEQEQLPCPRCDSTNTKFCYYNNYNYSQPRHFCKSCRRYWTHGGTLRDIPVGGGTRKNAKRCRTVTSNSSNVNINANTSAGQDYPLHATPVLVPFQGASAQFCGGGNVKGNSGSVGGCGNGSTSFASLLSPQGPGFLALGGFGLGLGSGFVGDVGFAGLGRGVWGLSGVGDGSAGVGANVGGGSSGGGHGGTGGMGNAWQFENGETTSGFAGAECFSWPDLAISTPGNGLKR